MKYIFYTALFATILLAVACGNKKQPAVAGHENHGGEPAMYTCPMPEDSVFSDKPGKCPKCGMDLERIGAPEVDLTSVLKPTNEFVISSIPVVTMQHRENEIEIEALGRIAYDTRHVGSISSRVSGRIEKLYVRYRYQRISKGQRIMDIYSPELLTAQQNLLFLLKNDPGNETLVSAAKNKLLLLGMDNAQLQKVIAAGKPSLTVAVYSNYSGHIHEGVSGNSMDVQAGAMEAPSQLTEDLSVKEGMYVQKGQMVFSVYNPDQAWAVLNIYTDNQSIIKVGNAVRIVPETAPGKDFRARIDFIEPFYREGSKTVTARVYFNNSALKIPVGSPVKASIFGNSKEAYWLPKEAVLSLGIDKVVFQKAGDGFTAIKVHTGIRHENHIQVLSGITPGDSVAVDAQYLMDSESFIKTNTAHNHE